MDDKLLRIDDALEIIHIGKSTFWKYVAEGQLPKPVKIGSSSLWRYSDLMQFIANAQPQTQGPAKEAA